VPNNGTLRLSHTFGDGEKLMHAALQDAYRPAA
jgi:hypothetical protein